MALPKKTLLAATLGMALIPSIAPAAGKFTAGEYQRALWMTTRFYGAQRMGHGPNWLLMDHPDKKSFVKDAADGRDLSGGWADCGDFPLFGQTFFYSAYVLLKAYDAFPAGFPDMYHGFDYSDYARTGVWDQNGGSPDGIPDLLQEAKYATDWLIKATPDAKTFYYQKGTGGAGQYGQHKYWVTSGYYSKTYKVAEGGESDGSRPILKLGATSGFSGEQAKNDGSMPSFAAAALAIMARVYRKYDASYADTCLKHARFAFDFAKQQDGTANTGFGGFYPANDHMKDDIVTAATELFKTTNEEAFREFAIARKDGPKTNHWYTFGYSTNDDVALFNLGSYLGMSDKMTSLKTNMVENYVKSATGEGGLSTIGDSWGFLRYPANQAFIAGLYSVSQNISTYDQFIYNQIDFILGGNTAKQSFIVGFCEGCSKSPQYPHHRNVYLDDKNDMKAIKSIPERNKQFGYLVGYTKGSSGSFTESMSAYEQTEGGIDYNAGLVGALGYIVSKLAPVDTSKFGTGTGNVARRVVQPLNVVRSGRSFEFRSPTGQALSGVKVLDASGREVWSDASGSASVRWSADRSGLYVVQAESGSQRYAASVAIP